MKIKKAILKRSIHQSKSLYNLLTLTLISELQSNFLFSFSSQTKAALFCKTHTKKKRSCLYADHFIVLKSQMYHVYLSSWDLIVLTKEQNKTWRRTQTSTQAQ